MPFFPPEIASEAQYNASYARSLHDPEGFWGEVAQTYTWQQPWQQVFRAGKDRPDFGFFEGAKLNLTENCLDRHLADRGQHTALVYEPNDPAQPVRKYTFRETYEEVNRLANALKALGVKKHDRVCLYLPMSPEAAFAMLACARIGAVHSVVFAGFSAQSLSDRINDAGSRYVLTADSFFRGTKEVPLKAIVDDALKSTPDQTVLVLRHSGRPIPWTEGRDIWWHDVVPHQPAECPAEPMDAEDPLFMLYTSGSTGKPKGLVHTQAGYMVYAGYTFRNVFQPRPDDLYWCTADVGWITGHSYLVYGPLLNGVTTLLFEGVPNYPDYGRFWDVVDKHKVNIFYTAPTAIRALEAAGLGFVQNKDLSSLRVLGTVGEPINQEAWEWYDQNVGRGRCPIVDTWWQTETGGIMMTSLAGVTPQRPTYAGWPMPGVKPVLMDEKGQEIAQNEAESVSGNLCIASTWPSQARTIHGDHDRFIQTYFSAYPGLYFTGDGCRRDPDGMHRITGRVDDVINVSGHRIGTAEVENAINLHDIVVESAVVGFPHAIKGQGIYAYVILAHETDSPASIVAAIKQQVAEQIGAFARPDVVQIVPGLPKTRSGKIMRRILRKIAEGDASNLGDTSTLLDPEVVDKIKAGRIAE